MDFIWQGVLYLRDLFWKEKPAPDSFPSPLIMDWSMSIKEKKDKEDGRDN